MAIEVYIYHLVKSYDQLANLDTAELIGFCGTVSLYCITPKDLFNCDSYKYTLVDQVQLFYVSSFTKASMCEDCKKIFIEQWLNSNGY